MRDKIGGFMSRDEMRAFLNNWISNYVVAQRRRRLRGQGEATR